MISLYHAAGTALYRAFGRGVAHLLARNRAVEAVFLHRSTATGEVEFARSDLDMGLVIRRQEQAGLEGQTLFELYRRVALLRRVNPAVGEIEIHDAAGLRDWILVDPYRGSLERRSLRWVQGEAVPLPAAALRPEDCARRAACWLEQFLPRALEAANGRNLRKYALETWNCYAPAAGILPEPLLTRTEILRHWRRAEPGLALEARLRQNPLSLLLEVCNRLHDRLLPPVAPLRESLVIERVSAPPWFGNRSVVFLPRPDSALPERIRRRRVWVFTPEAYHLYLHFMNPFAWWTTPAEICALGMQPPGPEAFRRAVEFSIHSQLLRFPGFMHQVLSVPRMALLTARHVLPFLEAGALPEPVSPTVGQQWRQQAPDSLEEYYRVEYPALCELHKELWSRVWRLRQDTLSASTQSKRS